MTTRPAPPGPAGARRGRRVAAALVLGAAGAASAWAGRIAWRTWDDLTPARIPASPAERARLPGAVEVTLRTSDGLDLRGWYAPSSNGAAVAFVHGLGGSRAQLLAPAAGLAARGYGVLVFDLRAHGESQGRRTSLGLHERRDVEAAVAFLAGRPEVDPRRIAAVGFSIGGMALAVEASGDPRLAAVVLAGTFPSLAEMVRLHEGALRGGVTLATLRVLGVDAARIRPEEALCRLAPRPLLLVFGDQDPATRQAGRLLARACGPARLELLPGVRHGDYGSSGGPGLERELLRFLDEALGERGRAAPGPVRADSPR